MVHDYARERINPIQWTPSIWIDFTEILRKLDELDKKLGQPECHDPAKAAWMKEIEAKLAALEDKVFDAF